MKRTEIAFTSIDPGYELVQRVMYGITTNSVKTVERSTKREMVIEFTGAPILNPVSDILPDVKIEEKEPRIIISINPNAKKKHQITTTILTSGGKKMTETKGINLDTLEVLLNTHVKGNPKDTVTMRAYVVTTEHNTGFEYTNVGFPNIYVDYVTLSPISIDDVVKFKKSQKIEKSETLKAYPCIEGFIKVLERSTWTGEYMIGTEPIIFVGTKFSGHSKDDIVELIVSPEINRWTNRYGISSHVNLVKVKSSLNVYDSSKRCSTEIGYKTGKRRNIISDCTTIKPLSWELLPDPSMTCTSEKTPYGDKLEFGHRPTPFIPPNPSEECQKVKEYMDTDTNAEETHSPSENPEDVKSALNAIYGTPSPDRISQSNDVMQLYAATRDGRKKAISLKSQYDGKEMKIDCIAATLEKFSEACAIGYSPEVAEAYTMIRHQLGLDNKESETPEDGISTEDTHYARTVELEKDSSLCEVMQKMKDADEEKESVDSTDSEKSDTVKLSDYMEFMTKALVFKPRDGETESDKKARFIELLSHRWDIFTHMVIANGVAPDVLEEIIRLRDQILSQFNETGECSRILFDDLGMLMADNFLIKEKSFKHYKYNTPVPKPTEEVKAPPICSDTPISPVPFKPLTEDERKTLAKKLQATNPRKVYDEPVQVSDANLVSDELNIIYKKITDDYIGRVASYVNALHECENLHDILTTRSMACIVERCRDADRSLREFRCDDKHIDGITTTFTNFIMANSGNHHVPADGFVKFKTSLMQVFSMTCVHDIMYKLVHALRESSMPMTIDYVLPEDGSLIEGSIESAKEPETPEDETTSDGEPQIVPNPNMVVNRLSDNQLVQITCEATLDRFIDKLEKYLFRLYSVSDTSITCVSVKSRKEMLEDAENDLKKFLGVIVSIPNDDSIISADNSVNSEVKNLNQYNTKLVDFIREHIDSGKIPASGLCEYYNSLTTVFDVPTADKIMRKLTKMLKNCPIVKSIANGHPLEWDELEPYYLSNEGKISHVDESEETTEVSEEEEDDYDISPEEAVAEEYSYRLRVEEAKDTLLRVIDESFTNIEFATTAYNKAIDRWNTSKTRESRFEGISSETISEMKRLENKMIEDAGRMHGRIFLDDLKEYFKILVKAVGASKATYIANQIREMRSGKSDTTEEPDENTDGEPNPTDSTPSVKDADAINNSLKEYICELDKNPRNEDLKKRLIIHCKPNLYDEYLEVLSLQPHGKNHEDVVSKMIDLISKCYESNSIFDQAVYNLEHAIVRYYAACKGVMAIE